MDLEKRPAEQPARQTPEQPARQNPEQPPRQNPEGCLTVAIRIPSVELKEEERVGQSGVYRKLFADKYVRWFFLGIVAYVGTEQSLANWMSQFLSTYHGLSPTVEGALRSGERAALHLIDQLRTTG